MVSLVPQMDSIGIYFVNVELNGIEDSPNLLSFMENGKGVTLELHGVGRMAVNYKLLYRGTVVLFPPNFKNTPYCYSIPIRLVVSEMKI